MAIDVSVIGPRGIGKTALIRRFCHLMGANFPTSEPHRGHLSSRVNFELDEVGVSLNIWDGYSCGLAFAKGVLLLFDPLKDNPLGELEAEIVNIRRGNPPVVILLVGTKADGDIDTVGGRAIEFAEEHGLLPCYYHTSAEQMINIRQPFEELVRGVLQRFGSPDSWFTMKFETREQAAED